MLKTFLAVFLLTFPLVTRAQTPDKKVGGPCDHCEIMYEGMPPDRSLRSECTISPPTEEGDRMDINGTVFHSDGKTPAKGIILYIYHTDAEGHYSPSAGQVDGRLHGHLRGWVITDVNGKFTLHTIRPAPYPNGSIPAHVHILVKEPGKTVYYIDEIWFSDDKLVTGRLRKEAEHRGGNQIITLKREHNVWHGAMTITLGLNIPGYP